MTTLPEYELAKLMRERDELLAILRKGMALVEPAYNAALIGERTSTENAVVEWYEAARSAVARSQTGGAQ